MSTKKINKQLNKINNLVSTLEEEESLSTIEHQLLLDYIKRLYEEALSIPLDGTSKKSKKHVAPTAELAQETKAAPVTPAPAPAPIREAEPTEVVKATPIVEKVAETPIAKPKVATPEPVVEQVKPQFIAPVEPSPTEDKTSSTDPKLLELFVEAKKLDLSDKFSQSPISDLRKAFGINEKIFTIQELFGGDNVAYDETINHLNGLPNYAVAREYMIAGVAKKFSWGEDKKFKKASKFIQLIRRRYN